MATVPAGHSVLRNLLERIRKESNGEVITRNRLAAVIRETMRVPTHHAHLAELVSAGHLEPLRVSERIGSYRVRGGVEVAVPSLVPKSLPESPQIAPKSVPSFRHICEEIECLAANIRDFYQYVWDEKGFREILALSNADSSRLAQCLKDIEKLGGDLRHFQEIAVRLRTNRGLADPDS